MYGPGIVTRNLSTPTRADKFGNVWQYHSRSDHHSKVACWAILFDLLVSCPLLAQHARQGRIGFGINHRMTDFRNNRKKDLDLVVCTRGGPETGRSFVEMGRHWKIALAEDEGAALEDLPPLPEMPVGNVLMALEAKACMTEHLKARPRLYDELNSSHLTIHGATDEAIAAGFVLVNAADGFLSPGMNKMNLAEHAPVWNAHRQPDAAAKVIEKVTEMPRRSRLGDMGFDALPILVVSCRNDGSPVELVTAPPAPQPGDIFHYADAVNRLGHLYSTRFGQL